MNYFTNLMSKFNNYKSRVDFFPSTYLKSCDLLDEIVDKRGKANKSEEIHGGNQLKISFSLK